MRFGALQLDVEEVVHCYQHSKRRLLVLGYNSTLTTSIEAPRQQAKRTFEQMQARSTPCRARPRHNKAASRQNQGWRQGRSPA